jgi:HEAT repeat protein
MADEKIVDAIISRLNVEKNDIDKYSAEAVTNMIWALGHLGNPKALSPIINVLTAVKARRDMSVETIQKEGLSALGRMGGKDAIYAIISHFSVPNAQEYALAAIKNIGAPASEYLIKVLELDDLLIRENALRALAEIGVKEAVDHVVPLLDDDDVRIAGDAALALAALCAH